MLNVTQAVTYMYLTTQILSICKLAINDVF